MGSSLGLRRKKGVNLIGAEKGADGDTTDNTTEADEAAARKNIGVTGGKKTQAKTLLYSRKKTRKNKKR